MILDPAIVMMRSSPPQPPNRHSQTRAFFDRLICYRRVQFFDMPWRDLSWCLVSSYSQRPDHCLDNVVRQRFWVTIVAGDIVRRDTSIIVPHPPFPKMLPKTDTMQFLDLELAIL